MKIKDAPIACASSAAWAALATHGYEHGKELWVVAGVVMVLLTVDWTRRAVKELDAKLRD